MTLRALHSLKSLNNSKLPDSARDVIHIRMLHLTCEFARDKKNLIDIRHSTTKRINTIIIYDGLQKKIYELEKLQKIILL